MGAQAQMLGKNGCDLVTGTDAFPAATGKQIFAFIPMGNTVIAEFDEIPVSIINNGWTAGDAADAVTVNDRSYCGVSLPAMAYIPFNGPVTSITLTSGSGIVYYL